MEAFPTIVNTLEGSALYSAILPCTKRKDKKIPAARLVKITMAVEMRKSTQDQSEAARIIIERLLQLQEASRETVCFTLVVQLTHMQQ